jgi:serine/threonine protein phosphatase PrpC
MLKISMSGNTDIGLVRRINEDSFLLLPEHNTLIVCDGMGGHAAGEVASQRAIDTVAAFLTHDRQAIAERLQTPSIPSMPPEALELAQSVRLANRSVFMKAQTQKGMHGMGTTLVAARFWNGCIGVCHVGDSRAYRFLEGKLEPWTTDHSLVAELKAQGEITEDQEKHFPERNVITRALGTRPSVEVDVRVDSTRQGEWFVLCSDGLCGYVDDKDIERTVAAAHPDQERAVKDLIERANQAGGHDNVTVAIAVVQESSSTFTMERLLETAPEATPEEAEQEMYLLRDLGLSIEAPEEAPTDEVDTDRIKIVSPPPGTETSADDPPTNPSQKLNPDPPDNEPKRKRKGGFWPWS